MIESSSENSIMDLEKTEYKRQNIMSDDRRETTQLLNDNNSNRNFPKIECIYISVITIALVAIVISILILNGKFLS